MGRVKVPMKKIANVTARQVTYSKRKSGLIKKAYELSVLCDIDIALITFSPSGKLNHFSGRKSVEDVLMRYINLPERERIQAGYYHKNKKIIADPQNLIRLLSIAKLENDMVSQTQARAPTPDQSSPSSSCPSTESNTEVEELQSELMKWQQHLGYLQQYINLFNGGPGQEGQNPTCADFDKREKALTELLERVTERKFHLLSKNMNSSASSSGYASGASELYPHACPPEYVNQQQHSMNEMLVQPNQNEQSNLQMYQHDQNGNWANHQMNPQVRNGDLIYNPQYFNENLIQNQTNHHNVNGSLIQHQNNPQDLQRNFTQQHYQGGLSIIPGPQEVNNFVQRHDNNNNY